VALQSRLHWFDSGRRLFVTATFTVVIPTHQRRDQLLMAVRSALAQTRPAEQIVVVADGCTDGSVEAVRELGHANVEVLDCPKGHRKGWSHRNEALRRARGDVIAYLADDDLWFPDHLERVGERFDAGGVDLVQARACLVEPGDELHDWCQDWSVPVLREDYLARRSHRTPMSCVSHRRGLAEEAGGWPEDPPGRWGDADLWDRILALEPATAALTEYTVLFFQSDGRDRPDQAAQTARFLARLEEPGGVPRLRAEIGRAAAAGHAREYARRDARIAALGEEVERLRERSDTLDQVTSGGWWRLRGRLLPLIRLRARLSPRAASSRTRSAR
jgi:glycosyltransferase involved in cell wall biosynthesis